MKRIYSILVENRSGVLSKVAGLFSRRYYNIDSLTVGETEDKDVSRITIVSSGDARIIEQIEKQLNKKLDVIKVKTYEDSQCINKELMMVKVRYSRNNRRDIMDYCQLYGAKIVDSSSSQMLLELIDTPERTAMFLKLLKGISIMEVARTGTLSLSKCTDEK